MEKIILIRHCLCVSVLFIPSYLLAQFPVSADRVGAGACFLFSGNAFSGSFGNMAAMDSAYSISAGVYSSRSFLLSELNESGIACNFRLPSSTIFSGGFAIKGYALYRRYYFSGALAKRFGNDFHAGVRFEVQGVEQGENYGSTRNYSCSGAALMRLSSKLDAATFFNIPVDTKSELASTDFSMGVRFRFSGMFHVIAESSLIQQSFEFRGSFNYFVHKRILISGGMGGRNLSLSFGCTMEMKNFKLMIAAAHRPVLGFSPAVGLSMGRP